MALRRRPLFTPLYAGVALVIVALALAGWALAGLWHAPGTVIVPDLRAVLACAVAGAGLAVLPRYLCANALDRGEVVALHDPPVPPLRTYFLVVRTGTLAMPHIARAHEWLLRAATEWA